MACYGGVAVLVSTLEATFVAQTIHNFIVWLRQLIYLTLKPSVYIYTNILIDKICDLLTNVNVCLCVSQPGSRRQRTKNRK